MYDGANDMEVAKVPYSPASGVNAMWIEDIVPHNGKLAFSVYDYTSTTTANERGRVFLLDPYTYAITQVGNAFGAGTGENTGGFPQALHSYGGFLWAGTSNSDSASADTGKIWKIRAEIEETWTLDSTTAAGQGFILAFCTYRGELYAGTTGNDSTPASEAALVLKRATTGVWTTSDTAVAIPTGGNGYTSMIVFEDNLYAAWYGEGGANDGVVIRKYDGSSWTTDYDIEAQIGIRSMGKPLIFGGNLYWVVADAADTSVGAIIKKASGGAWSIVTSTKNVHGGIGYVAVVT
jgi:hypothetical protein